MAGGFLNTVLRHTAQIGLTDMTGSQEFAGIWKRREQVYAVPSYYVFRMYSAVKGDAVLPVTTDSGTYDVSGGTRPLDVVSGVPYIDVVATRSTDGKHITLLCLNRDLTQDLPVRFDLAGVTVNGEAQMQRIAASSRYERNDEVEPHHIQPLTSTIPVLADGRFALTLPHESVSVIRVPVH